MPHPVEDSPPTPPTDGWTLSEALPIIAGEEVFAAYLDARRELAAVPPQLAPQWMNPDFDRASRDQIRGENERRRDLKSRRSNELVAAKKALWSAFRDGMRSGRFAARGRVGNILGEAVVLSADQWSGLVEFDAEASIVGDGYHGGVEIHGLRIVAAGPTAVADPRSAQEVTAGSEVDVAVMKRHRPRTLQGLAEDAFRRLYPDDVSPETTMDDVVEAICKECQWNATNHPQSRRRTIENAMRAVRNERRALRGGDPPAARQ